MNRAAFLLLLLAAPAFAETPAERAAAAAEARLAAAPDAAAFRALAVALTRRARETGDGAYYDRALDALEKARARSPGEPETDKVEAWTRLGRHEFARAEALAQGVVGKRPEDAEAWGLLGDARMELGKYNEAAEDYQRAMRLRPGPGADLRAAYWREATGDLRGASEFLARALKATPSRETEARAWILVQWGGLLEKAGDFAAADRTMEAALAAFPDYHFALVARARLALKLLRPADALELAGKALEKAPSGEPYLLMADALRALGLEEKAREMEDLFEALALGVRDRPANENGRLADFYLSRRPDAGKALLLARGEAAARRDAATLARLAAALAANGERREARRVMADALRAGTRDPEILARAEKLGIEKPRRG